MVGVRKNRSGSCLWRDGKSVFRMAVMYGSEESVLRSPSGRFVARWKVNFTVYPGGACGMGVSSKPPGRGFSGDAGSQSARGFGFGVPGAPFASGVEAGGWFWVESAIAAVRA